MDRLCSSLHSLLTILRSLQKLWRLVNFVQMDIAPSNCKEVVHELQGKVVRAAPPLKPREFKDDLMVRRYEFAYPLCESTLRFQEDVEEVRQNLSLTLNVLNFFTTQKASKNCKKKSEICS